MTLSDEKSRLRRELKAIRASLDAATRQQASQTVCNSLWTFLQELDIESVGVYLARPVEISLDPLIEKLLAASIHVSAPRLDLEKVAMSFRSLDSLDDLYLGPFNVREPLGKRVSAPDFILIPGLGFDAQGHRLGMGGGWYDRTLASDMMVIGVCFDCQIVPSVPVEEHDRNVNWVFTEKRELGQF